MPTNPTRRTIFAVTAAVAVSAISRSQQPAMLGQPGVSAKDVRTAIHYELEFKPSPQRLYSAILDDKQFAKFSGLAATIDPAPGGAFTMFGGQVTGRNIELVPDQRPNPRIVQAWRPASWDPGVYSIVHFEFKQNGAGTKLIFDHTGFPAGDYDGLDWGWTNHYWDPLRKFLA